MDFVFCFCKGRDVHLYPSLYSSKRKKINHTEPVTQVTTSLLNNP